MALDKKYIIQIRTIITNRGLTEEDKEDLVSQFSNQRTTSIRAMKTTEAIALIKALNGESDTFRPDNRLNRMQRKILALAHEMDWETEDGKINMDRVNGFCKMRGYRKKTFNDYTEKELPKLITQFEKMYKNHLEKCASNSTK